MNLDYKICYRCKAEIDRKSTNCMVCGAIQDTSLAEMAAKTKRKKFLISLFSSLGALAMISFVVIGLALKDDYDTKNLAETLTAKEESAFDTVKANGEPQYNSGNVASGGIVMQSSAGIVFSANNQLNIINETTSGDLNGADVEGSQGYSYSGLVIEKDDLICVKTDANLQEDSLYEIVRYSACLSENGNFDNKQVLYSTKERITCLNLHNKTLYFLSNQPKAEQNNLYTAWQLSLDNPSAIQKKSSLEASDAWLVLNGDCLELIQTTPDQWSAKSMSLSGQSDYEWAGGEGEVSAATLFSNVLYYSLKDQTEVSGLHKISKTGESATYPLVTSVELLCGFDNACAGLKRSGDLEILNIDSGIAFSNSSIIKEMIPSVDVGNMSIGMIGNRLYLSSEQGGFVFDISTERSVFSTLK